MIKPKTRRLFLINLQGLSVFSLYGKVLTHVARFSDEDIGYEDFKSYLAENPQHPVTIIVDSVAEDFVVEKVPHVSAMDRKSFLKRKADQNFRGIDYVSARIIGRETSGRKNDKVLFSAISKNQALEPWVRALLHQEIPIRSITTPAYALCKMAQELDLLTAPNVLLVSWEVSGIRHTFIENGRTMFSRLTPLPADDEADLAEAIIDSCDQSNDYLERIGLIGFEDSMDVHVITPQLPDDIFANIPSNRNFRQIIHHNSIDMMDPEHYKGPQNSITAILLCLDWAIRRGELANIYAPPAAVRFLDLTVARRIVAMLCVLVFGLGTVNALPLLLESLDRRSRVTDIENQIFPVRMQYDALTDEFPDTPIPSEALELAVGTYNDIERQAQSPFVLIAPISQVLRRFPTIELSSVEWNLNSDEDAGELTQALLGNRTEPVLDIYGSLRGSRSIGDSDRRLREFIAELNAEAGLSATPILLPIDSGPEGAVSTVIDDLEVSVQFAIRVSRGN